MTALYVGLISGTSVDGIDAVLAEIDADSIAIRAARTLALPRALAARVGALIADPRTGVAEYGAVDAALGEAFADAALALLAEAGTSSTDVRAIGLHGQTVYHDPDAAEAFTLQIGDPTRVAARTRITTVADFRRLDIAHGGQGAPLVPALHEAAFGDAHEARVVVNIGGIANVTVLRPGRPTLGFDTGPGNTLLDQWIRRARGKAYDADGAWAATGRVDAELLEKLLTEPYFKRQPPKSTGRERFNPAWLAERLAELGALAPEDVQATLAELTAATIVEAATELAPGAKLVVCGGGAHNADLIARLARRTEAEVVTSDTFGIAPDWVEGAAFAWLAHARLEHLAGNVPTVTGARQAAVLGGVYWGGEPETSPKHSVTPRGHDQSQGP